MLYRMKEDEYARVRPLFAGLRYNLVVDSIIDGNTPAWVYADDAAQPATALMWNRQDALLLAGEAGNDTLNQALGQLIAGQVVPDARQRYIPELCLHYASPAWESRAALILADLHPERARRRFYAFAGPTVDWRAQMPAGYRMAPIDGALLDDGQLENTRHVAGWVRSFWRSQQDFDRTGFGFCLLHGEAVVSWCLSVYASGRDFELGLATLPDHRNRGLATLAAAACVEHCAARGWTPHWHCWEDNAPSIAVAEKVGFVKPTTYKVYRFEVEPRPPSDAFSE